MILFILLVSLSIIQPLYGDETPYVRMYLFSSKGCEDCKVVKEKIIPQLTQRYGPSIKVKEFEIDDPKAYRLMLRLEKTYDHRLKNPPPTIFIGNDVLDGIREIHSRLNGIVRELYLRGGSQWPEPKKETNDIVIERFKELGILAILTGGLLDGVNPCALTVLILFVSYLFLIGRKGKQILYVGVAFTSAIFLSYLLVGIGLFEFIMRIPPLFNRILLILVACGTLLLGITNLYDYYRIRWRNFGMSCPMAFGKISSLLKRYAKVRYYVIGTFITGFMVSFLEFFCTGQIYLPVIFVLRYVPGFRLHAFLYLLLYNLMFILPLIVVFLFGYYGVSSEWFSRFAQRHLEKTKILTAILFFWIAGILITMLLTGWYA